MLKFAAAFILCLGAISTIGPASAQSSSEAAIASGAVVGKNFRGKIVYKGTYTGFQSTTDRKGTRRQDLAGAITVTVTFDGAAAKGRFESTGLLDPSNFSGVATDGTCKLYTPPPSGLLSGQCDFNRFNVVATSDNNRGGVIQIAFDAAATAVEDYAARDLERGKQAAAAAQERAQAKKDDEEGMVRLTRKALAGDVDAQRHLSVLYTIGTTNEKNDVKATEFARMCADKGDADCQAHLSHSLHQGRGVAIDKPAAHRYSLLASGQGNSRAMGFLAINYYSGDGVIKDYVKSYKWSLLASATQKEPEKVEAMNALQRDLEARLKPSDVEAAQRQARACMARNFKNCD